MKVALIYGGEGCEREVSERGFDFVYPTLKKNFQCLAIYIDKDGRWLTNGGRVYPTSGGFLCPESSDFYPIDCALPLLHGDFGEDGIVQGTLEVAKIPYIGCDSRVGAICRDKAVVKCVAERLGIPTLPFITLARGEKIPRLDYPIFVKPTCLGSSIGASGAKDEKELRAALESAFTLCDRVIIERLLSPKRELECGYYAEKGKELFTNVGEILTDGFYDYEKKYRDNEIKVIPRAPVAEEINRRAKEYSRRLVHALGIRQICRVDFFLSGEELYFNEINTMPGFTEGSLYHKMLADIGIELPKLLCGLVHGCL